MRYCEDVLTILNDQSIVMASSELTIGASEFKAKCLEILKRLDEHRLRKVTITRRGKPVAELRPRPDASATVKGSILGCMKGSVVIPPGLDLTAPVFDWDPDQ